MKYFSRKSPQNQSDAQAGFTIIELMIATLVFSVILVVVTYGVLHFTNAYYQGVNSSTTQNTTRAALDTISQGIQFSNTTITPTAAGNDYFCTGGKVFLFSQGVMLTSAAPTNANLGLYMMDNSGGSTCVRPAAPTGGTELLAPNMRVANVAVQAVSDTVYNVSLRVIYGDDDLLISPSGSSPAYKAADARCSGQSGSQFCATSELTTTVATRVKSGT